MPPTHICYPATTPTARRHTCLQGVQLPEERRALEKALRVAQDENWRFAEEHGARVAAEEVDAGSARLVAAAGRVAADQAALGQYAHATVRFAVGETARADEKV